MRTHGRKPKATVAVYSSSVGCTLPQLLFLVPDLLPQYLLGLWPSRGAGIRELRLVSKKVGSIALRAVKTCEITLGEWYEPRPEEVALLMGGAQLETLELHILTYPGTPYPSPEQQLATCTSQMALLLARLGPAVQTVTNLKLLVIASPPHPSCRIRSYDRDDDGIDKYYNPDRQGKVSHVTAAACAMLATALPVLRHLTLRGVCVDVALCAFGANCKQLSSLKVEALLVPTTSLHNIDVMFPNLSHFTINTRGPLSKQHCVVYASDVERYVHRAFSSLTGCTKLKTVQLSLQPEDGGWRNSTVVMERSPWVWDNLPLCVDELLCDVEVEELLSASAFMSRVRSLSLRTFPYDNLPEFLLKAPLLQKLAITCRDTVEVAWDDDIAPADLATVKARLLGGFQLSCKYVSMRASKEILRDLSMWLSPLLNTKVCSIRVESTIEPTIETTVEPTVKPTVEPTVQPTVVSTAEVTVERTAKSTVVSTEDRLDFLDQFVRMCPALTELTLSEDVRSVVQPLLKEEVLSPLAGLAHLEQLAVNMRISFTTAGVISLVSSLPSLSHMDIPPCESVCCITVVAELKVKGRVVKLFDESDDE